MQIIRRIFLDGYHSIFCCPGQKYGVDRGRDPEVLTLNLRLDFIRNSQKKSRRVSPLQATYYFSQSS